MQVIFSAIIGFAFGPNYRRRVFNQWWSGLSA